MISDKTKYTFLNPKKPKLKKNVFPTTADNYLQKIFDGALERTTSPMMIMILFFYLSEPKKFGSLRTDDISVVQYILQHFWYH